MRVASMMNERALHAGCLVYCRRRPTPFRHRRYRLAASFYRLISGIHERASAEALRRSCHMLGVGACP